MRARLGHHDVRTRLQQVEIGMIERDGPADGKPVFRSVILLAQFEVDWLDKIQVLDLNK